MGYIKRKSSLMIFDRDANLKYTYGNRQFWCKGYYVGTVGRNKKGIAEYIRNQLAEHKISHQLMIKEKYDDPLVGPLVRACGRQTVSPRLEARLVLDPYRVNAGHPFHG